MAEAAHQVPDDRRYSSEHEWLRLEGDLARVGITDYAQQQLGDIVYVSLPKPGTALTYMAPMGEIESVKVASELFSPASGEVVEVNPALEAEPELVNKDPFGGGWLVVIRLTDTSANDGLFSSERYLELIRREQGLST